MPTLKEVAKRAGVSIATVSYYINGSQSLKADTRLRVMQAIEDLNYIPNRAAKNLRNPSNNEIGIVLPDIEDPYHSEILQGIVFEAENEGFNVNIAFSYWLADQECRIIRDFISRNISGLILLTCQPANTAFFKKNIISLNLPNVFVDRIPRGLNVNFQTYDNYTTIHYLTKKLLMEGYERIGLMTGPEEELGESDSYYAFTDAHIELNKTYDQDLIYSCNSTKEDAFRVLINAMAKHSPPQAIITSSENIMKGVVEALDFLNIRIPEDICVITLGIECWNKSNYHPKVIHTSRQANTLGRYCCQLLIRNIRSERSFETEFMLHQERQLEESIVIPRAPQPFFFRKNTRTIKILSMELPTIAALLAVSQEFSNRFDARIQIDYLPIRELFKKICEDSKQEKGEYDLYVVDVSWMRYLVQEGCLRDITDFMTSKKINTAFIVPKNLENVHLHNHYYGLPIIGGTHLLFYRRDFFSDISLQRAFKYQHHIGLRPPRTWTEFNGTARFFTKSLNPGSPSVYGTAMPSKLSEELILDILIRLWSFGGGLYNENRQMALNTPQNIRGFLNIIETCSYVDPEFMQQNHQQAFSDFASGKIAMLVSFTEYAGAIKNFIPSDLMPNVGYCMLPGGTPANVGWQLGVSPTTGKLNLIQEFFQWICQKNISYYMTILDGQAVMKYPYQNRELLRLYPWLELTDESISLSRSRVYPSKGRHNSVAPYQTEAVICRIFQRILKEGIPVEQALKEGEEEMYKLMA